MAVEYETTPSTPGNPNPNGMFPLTGTTVKKRVMKHTNQENFRAGLFFCGKRKRSHRDRYYDYDRLHSSSVPRQREFYTSKNASYLEYKNRSRSSYARPCERILPLNKNIISKIERISQDSMNNSGGTSFASGIVSASDNKHVPTGFLFNSAFLNSAQSGMNEGTQQATVNDALPHTSASIQMAGSSQAKSFSIDGASGGNVKQLTKKSGSFDSTFHIEETSSFGVQLPSLDINGSLKICKEKTRKSQNTSRHSNHKRKSSKRNQLKMQFSGQTGMDCGLNDFLSSSSLSSSDSEGGETNESDREGDDELTDWPGNEAMVNFASKNDFKRAKPTRTSIHNAGLNKLTSSQTRFGNDDYMAQDEDTLMSADETPATYTSHSSQNQTEQNILLATEPNIFASKFPASMHCRLTSNDSQTPSPPSTTDNQFTSNSSRVLRNSSSLPIDIVSHGHPNLSASSHATQIESEMSGETSNPYPFLSSPAMEVREFRAGCRRVRDERPGFTIFSSVNEHLSRCVFVEEVDRSGK